MQISNLSISLLAVYSFWNEYLDGSVKNMELFLYLRHNKTRFSHFVCEKKYKFSQFKHRLRLSNFCITKCMEDCWLYCNLMSRSKSTQWIPCEKKVCSETTVSFAKKPFLPQFVISTTAAVFCVHFSETSGLETGLYY